MNAFLSNNVVQDFGKVESAILGKSMLEAHDTIYIRFDEKIDVINHLKELLHGLSPFKNEPVDFVKWVKADCVTANDYNPNKVAPPEMKLLEESINQDGYTQPIVSWINKKGNNEVVDGFGQSRSGIHGDPA